MCTHPIVSVITTQGFFLINWNKSEKYDYILERVPPIAKSIPVT
jgi:hypothetical protein